MSTQTQIQMFEGTESNTAKLVAHVKKIVDHKFDVTAFVDNFEVLAEAQGGTSQLRNLVLELAITGRLGTRVEGATSASFGIRAERNALQSHQGMAGRTFEESAEPSEQLPPAWEWMRLGEIVRDHGQKVPDSRFTYIDVSSIDSARGLIRGDVKVLDAHHAPSRARKLVAVGSVIYATVRPYLLNVAVIETLPNPKPIVSTAFAVLHPIGGVESWYLYHLLRSPFFVEYVSGRMKGVAYPAINDRELYSAWVPVPPLAEQKRIVGKVDKLMRLLDGLEAKQTKRRETQVRLRTAALDALTSAEGPEGFRAAWKRAEENFGVLFERRESVKDLRGTILSQALSGRLVSHEHHDALSEVAALKPEVVATAPKEHPYRLPDHWCWLRLEHLLATLTDGDHQPPPQVSSGVSFLTIGNVSSGTISFDDSRFVPREYFEKLDRRRVPRKGDILYTVVGATYGRPVAVETDRPFCVQRHIAIMKPDASCERNFLLLFLRSPLAYRQATASITGTAQPTVPLKPLRRLLVPVPPLAEQQRIVAKVEHLMKLCDDLEAKLRRAETTAAKLVEAVVAEMVA